MSSRNDWLGPMDHGQFRHGAFSIRLGSDRLRPLRHHGFPLPNVPVLPCREAADNF